MATATRMEVDGTMTEVAAADHPASGAATRAPALKRPDNVSDSEWAIMRTARNEDVVKRINDIMGDTGKPCGPEEASVLMDIVAGAEYRELQQIKKLRESLAPKIKGHAAVANALLDVKMRLFRLASAV